MSRLLFTLAVSLGSILAGYLAQRLLLVLSLADFRVLAQHSRSLKLAAFFFMNPVAVLSTFWGLRLPSAGVLVLPALGLGSVALGGAAALLVVHLARMPRERGASVFTCGAFSNVLTFGGLIAYGMFGEQGYALTQLYNMAMSPAYYMIGYPMSANIARGERRVLRVGVENLRENPYLIIPLLAIAAGIAAQAAGIQRPAEMGGIVSLLVPCVAASLGAAIGLTLRLGRVGEYWREIGIVLAIRHLFVPAVVIPLAALLGMGRIASGVPLKVVVIAAVMPVAFNALGPPAIYGFDLDLANSAWMVSTLLLVAIVPLLFALL